MIRRMLVPLDGSVVAESVLPSVEVFARMTQAEVTLLRVVQPVDDMLAAPPGGISHDAIVERDAETYLATVAKRLASAGIAVQTTVLVGHPAEQIIHDGQGYDLIAMGTHGRSGIGRWVYGSVADKVIRNASVPVLVIRARADVPPPVEQPRLIVVPLDGSPLAELALPLASEVARDASAEVRLVESIHWIQMALLEYPYGFGPGFNAASLLEDAEAEARAYLGDVAQRLRAEGLTVSASVRLEPAADVILEEAIEHQAGLIVMSTHGRGGLGRWVLGSTADRVLHEATLPVLLVRAGVAAGESLRADTLEARSETA